MCLIIKHGTTTNILPREVFDYVYSRNRDGYGVMWVENGRVNIFKTINWSPDQIYDHMKTFEGRKDVVFHLRMRTDGPIVQDLCHPFRVLRKTTHGKDIVMMHNGVIRKPNIPIRENQSDTTAYNKQVLIPKLSAEPDLIHSKDWVEALTADTVGSRLCFMVDSGEIITTGFWHDRYGCSVSNLYMLPVERTNYAGNYSYSGGTDTTWRRGYDDSERYAKYWREHWKKDCFDDVDSTEDTTDNVITLPAATRRANQEEQLRWFRIHANVRTGYAADGTQLLADLMTQPDEETESMCKDAPDAAAAIIKSLCDWIITQATEYTNLVDWEDLHEMQLQKNHPAAMKRIVYARFEQQKQNEKRKVN